MTNGTLHPMQENQLRAPINGRRVLKANNHSHLSQQDVTAHLIRVFGYGGFDTELKSVELVFEEPNTTKQATGRFNVCYRAVVRITIRDIDGNEVAHYEDGSTGTAQNQNRGDGHDLAMKSAISLAKKRATINLGDQFGLSLYNKGQTAPLVLPPGKDTIASTARLAHLAEIRSGVRYDGKQEVPDMQEHITEQLSLGDTDPESEVPEERDPAEVQASLNRSTGKE